MQELIPGGRLWRCTACESMFRHPILPWPTYQQLYESGAATQWSGGEHRHDLEVVRSIIAAEKVACSVLDVGCGAGDFLLSLPAAHTRAGIEPSVAAAAGALARGVSVVAGSVSALPSGARFDVITIVDVIEHVPDPGSLLREAYEHVSPGGLLIVSTGDPENPLWRGVFKSRFWYCSFPEHLSFPSCLFFRNWGASQQARAVTKLAIRYQACSLWEMAVGWVMQAAYLVSPAAFNWVGRCTGRLLRPAARRRRSYSPGVPGLFVDHQVVTIRRSE